ncbi:hypothetical protein [Dokdonella sp.]|jgi:hypothetical protein|uniref:hypothetical protein n=1 Tax=Dokdonella sp. TaxID=2291710 RepID=UPI002CC132F4|nr:hypothetical protein [Dokdonella sp.]HNV09402.1 hypothetical protein [Dokdonella sp.]HPW04304.1 hypothetical protein [Dokdonella sp.]
MLKIACRLLALVVIAGTAACDRDPGPIPPPSSDAVQTVQASIRLAREGDIAGLLELSLPPAEFTRMKTEWDQRASEHPVSDDARKRFAEAMTRLTAKDAETGLFKQLEPDIRQFDAQYKNQLPAILAMGSGYVTGLIHQSQNLTTAEKQRATQVLDAVVSGLQTSHPTDPEKARKALVVAIETARALNLKTLDEARSLSFDQAAPKMKSLARGLKRILEVYGFSVDATLDSIKVTETTTNDPNLVKLQISYDLAGTPVQTESDMVRVDGRWYDRDTIDKLARRTGSTLNAPAVPAGE